MRELTFTVCYIQGWGRGFQHHIAIGNTITSLQKTRFRVKYIAAHLVRAGDGIHSRSVWPKICVHSSTPHSLPSEYIHILQLSKSGRADHWKCLGMQGGILPRVDWESSDCLLTLAVAKVPDDFGQVFSPIEGVAGNSGFKRAFLLLTSGSLNIHLHMCEQWCCQEARATHGAARENRGLETVSCECLIQNYW